MLPMKNADTPPSVEVSTPAQVALYQKLRGHLAHLKLADAAEALPGVLDAARADGMSLTAALEQLLRIEVDAVEARKLAGRLRFACLPTPATLTDIDYDASGSLDRRLIEELGTCRYLETASIVFADPRRPDEQDVGRGRAGPPGRARQLPHLLHHRHRSGREVPQGRDRGPVGHDLS